MFDSDLKAQLEASLVHLKGPVVLTAHLDESESSREMRTWLDAVASASPLVSLVTVNPEQGRVPSFGIARQGEEARVRFAGIPAGHEFTSLVLALLHVSGHPPRIPAPTLATVESLSVPLHFVTYFSATCQNCPDVVQALNILAARNPRITHEAVDGAQFREEVEGLQIKAVPTVYLNGEPFGQGRMELDEILPRLDATAREHRIAELKEKAPYDVLIVGGGPAGATAAIYSARKGLRTGVVATRFGGQVGDTLAIENFTSLIHTEGPALVTALEGHVAHYNVDIMKGQKVTGVRPGPSIDVELENGVILKAKSLILATGARYRDMNVPGEAEYRTRGVTYCPHCDGPLFKGKAVAVIGGGNSGVEAAIDLAGVTEHVTLLEFASSLRADEVLQKKLMSLPNVRVIKSAKTLEVLGDGKEVTGLKWENREDGSVQTLPVRGIFVQIGLLPCTEFLGGLLEKTRMGEIIVDAKGATSVPGIFAAGDATNVPYKQIVIAAGDGAKAALSAFEHLIRSPSA